MKKIEELFLEVPISQWTVRQIIAFDYYDGARSGLCAFSIPNCEVMFKLLDERFDSDGLEDRVYRLSELSEGTLTYVENLTLESQLLPKGVSTVVSTGELTQKIAAVLTNARETNLIILSKSFHSFSKIWHLSVFPDNVENWFGHLKV